MIRRQEFFDGEVRKLHHPRTPVIDDGDQTRTCGQYGLFLVLRTPVRLKRRNASLRLSPGRVKVKCKDFGQFLDTKRPDGNREAVKETTSIFSVVIVDILQHAFVSLVQRLR